MPAIDLLVITHDHWDHLDYRTVRELKDRIGKVVCPLGVGEHFERWGFAPERIVELDWDEDASPVEGVRVFCLTSRHFSGRGLNPNKSLWASFLLETSARKIYIGGDGGYGSHFAQIGESASRRSTSPFSKTGRTMPTGAVYIRCPINCRRPRPTWEPGRC